MSPASLGERRREAVAEWSMTSTSRYSRTTRSNCLRRRRGICRPSRLRLTVGGRQQQLQKATSAAVVIYYGEAAIFQNDAMLPIDCRHLPQASGLTTCIAIVVFETK